VAIRPTDIQAVIWQSTLNAPVTQRAEENARLAQAAAQNAFVNQTDVREETVHETGKALGNKIDPNAQHQRQNAEEEVFDEHGDRGAFEDVVDQAAGLDEPPHLIDFTA
jgi:hypothetical protein